MGKCHARVVVLLVDHVDLRPGGELHIVVRALQACAHNQLAGCIQAWKRMGKAVSGKMQHLLCATRESAQDASLSTHARSVCLVE